MFHRYSECAQRALDFAQQEALAWNHRYLGCEHLLIGLLKTRDSTALAVLSEFKIDVSSARTVLSELVHRGEETVAARQRLPRTRRARMALKSYAPEEARRFGQRAIGTEHLLLALLRDDESMALKLLAHLDLNPDGIRAAVVARVGSASI